MSDVSQITAASEGAVRTTTRGVTREFLNFELSDGQTAKLVTWFGRKVCRGLGLNGADYRDVCQELRNDLSCRSRHYDPDRGPWLAYARLVLDHHATVLSHRYYDNRQRNKAIIQSRLQHGSRHNGGYLEPDAPAYQSCEGLDLKIDLADTISTFQPQWAELCRLLQRGHSTAAAASIMGVPRTTARGWVQRIRRCFEDRQLDKYL